MLLLKNDMHEGRPYGEKSVSNVHNIKLYTRENLKSEKEYAWNEGTSNFSPPRCGAITSNSYPLVYTLLLNFPPTFCQITLHYFNRFFKKLYSLCFVILMLALKRASLSGRAGGRPWWRLAPASGPGRQLTLLLLT